MAIAIVVTMCNEVEYSKQMVESIKSSTPYYLVLIDDYSIDGTKSWIKDLQPGENCVGIEPIIDADTDSLGEKWNLGAEKAKELGCEYALICNNDIVLHPKTIDNLVTRMEKGDVSVVSAHNRRGDTHPDNILTIEIPHPHSEAEHPDFSCFLLKVSDWEKVGKFPTIYKPCYFEDNDFHTMLRLYNLKAITTTKAPYYHYGSITQNSVQGGLCKGPQFEHNRDLFKEKFGCLPADVDANLDTIRAQLGITI